MEREFGIANREEWPTAANCEVVFKTCKFSMQPVTDSNLFFFDKLKTTVFVILLQNDWHWRSSLHMFALWTGITVIISCCSVGIKMRRSVVDLTAQVPEKSNRYGCSSGCYSIHIIVVSSCPKHSLKKRCQTDLFNTPCCVFYQCEFQNCTVDRFFGLN